MKVSFMSQTQSIRSDFFYVAVVKPAAFHRRVVDRLIDLVLLSSSSSSFIALRPGNEDHRHVSTLINNP